jgi:hypothetical protein
VSREEHQQEVSEWEEAECQECGLPFPRKESYKELCPICFKESRGYNILQGDLAFLWAQQSLEEARSEGEKAKTKARKARASAIEALQQAARSEERAVAAEKATRRAKRGRKNPAQLDPVVIKALISLCHPDKHGGSKKATEVTKLLLSMRSGTR